MMFHIVSMGQLKALMTDVINLHKGFVTNLYLDEFKHNVWIQHQDFFYEKIGETCFFIKRSSGFWNVFYCSVSLHVFKPDLELLKGKYPDKTMFFDIIGRDAQCVPVIEMFRGLGFELSTSLVRMNRMAKIDDYVENDVSVTKATPEEVINVYLLLHQYFDEKTEQIPYQDELEAYAQDGHILVCHEGSQIAGFLIYEMKTTTLYLRYWFTHPDYRENKVGSRLFHKFLEIGKTTKRQFFWVIQTNENAIERYRHYGFKDENMFDYVMRIN
ncbi:MAG: GNAT family N-acetyltransferase [Bacteroidales bacterium]|nr:GNAT family N-acetyltransferase [Bacteroidales bacterium]